MDALSHSKISIHSTVDGSMNRLALHAVKTDIHHT